MASLKISDLSFASASKSAATIHRGEITSLDLTKHILDRIERYNPILNAIVTLTKREALATAKATDDSIDRGKIIGPLHGVPITIKDCFEVAGVRTTAGSPKLSNNIPQRDASAVARLRKSGAVILGKTNVPIMAGNWQTYNKIFGTTNNPWDTERTPGGSTGGGAAALAAGLSYLSLGSDIGGSIRIPSHFCGLYGHKTSLNVVSYQGHIPKSAYHPPLLTVAGTLSRSPQDLRLSLETIGGPSAEEEKAYTWTLPPARGERLSDYHIGFVSNHEACLLTEDVEELIKGSLDKLGNKVAVLKEGWPKGVNPVEQWTTYRFLLASVYASFLRDEDFEEKREQARDQNGNYENIVAKAWTAPHKHFQVAHAQRMKAMETWRSFFEDYDAFVMPVAFTPAFPHDHSQPFWSRRIPTSVGPRRYEDLYFWISFATLSGLPATVAPIGYTPSGLPVGIQIVGPYLEDATTIDIAARTEKLFGGFQPPKDYL